MEPSGCSLFPTPRGRRAPLSAVGGPGELTSGGLAGKQGNRPAPPSADSAGFLQRTRHMGSNGTENPLKESAPQVYAPIQPPPAAPGASFPA